MRIKGTQKDLALDCFLKKNKSTICTEYLPNENDVDPNLKFDDLDDDTSKGTNGENSNLMSEVKVSQTSPEKGNSTSFLGTQNSMKEGFILTADYEQLTFGSQLENERQKFFGEIDFESFTYPKTGKINKFLDTKDYNFWAEGVAMMDKVLHDQIESIEREITHCASMTFNR